MSISIAENCDCMEAMTNFPDKYFELAIVDVPYGINMDGGKIGGDNKGIAKNYLQKGWDSFAPSGNYFSELKRVSKNQIIWGANHFIDNLDFKKNSSCWIVWDKLNTGNFADCELAWTSFDTAVRIFRFTWNGMIQGDMKNKETRIHPTQKPIALYKWLLKNYAKQGDKILDTHLGSGSSRIACYDMGFDFWGYEKDIDYWTAQEKRFKDFVSQTHLFRD